MRTLTNRALFTLSMLIVLSISYETHVQAQSISKPKQSSSKAFSPVKPIGEDEQQYIFNFSASGNKYSIRRKGKVTQISKGTIRSTVNLEKDSYIEALFFTEYGKNLILVCQIGEGGYGWGNILSLDKQNLKLKWKATIPAFNVGRGLVEDSYAYVTALGFVGKIDLKAGKYVWKHDGLYERYPMSNDFQLPRIEGRTISIQGSKQYRQEAKTIVLDKNSGKILGFRK